MFVCFGLLLVDLTVSLLFLLQAFLADLRARREFLCKKIGRTQTGESRLVSSSMVVRRTCVFLFTAKSQTRTYLTVSQMHPEDLERQKRFEEHLGARVYQHGDYMK